MLNIGKQDVHVWLTFYDRASDPGLIAKMRTLLANAEREQELRFYFADDRTRYLVTRALVRTVLSLYCPSVPPAAWRFASNAYGRPRIANREAGAEGLIFNISHTRGLIALAVSRQREIGVDVEHLGVRQVALDLAERFFAPAEAADLAAVPPELGQHRFFEYWTFKESYIKAREMGLSLPLDQFQFRFPCDRSVDLEIAPGLNDHAARWLLAQYRPTAEHLLAICAERLEGDVPQITLRTVIPLRGDFPFDMLPHRTSGSGAA